MYLPASSSLTHAFALMVARQLLAHQKSSPSSREEEGQRTKLSHHEDLLLFFSKKIQKTNVGIPREDGEGINGGWD